MITYHGYNDGCNNPMHSAHKTWVNIIQPSVPDHTQLVEVLPSPEASELCVSIRFIASQCDPRGGWNSGFYGATTHLLLLFKAGGNIS